MSRSKAKSYLQPNDYTCGPASLKTALEILGVKHSITYLTRLCNTSKNGTSLKNLIKAANKLGLSVLAVEKATVRHLQKSIKSTKKHPRAVIVNYLYGDALPIEETGHYSTVASYSQKHRKITLFDPYIGGKKSFNWKDFLDRWYDYDYKRVRFSIKNRYFRMRKTWQFRLMIVFTKNPDHLPQFKIATAKVFSP